MKVTDRSHSSIRRVSSICELAESLHSSIIVMSSSSVMFSPSSFEILRMFLSCQGNPSFLQIVEYWWYAYHKDWNWDLLCISGYAKPLWKIGGETHRNLPGAVLIEVSECLHHILIRVFVLVFMNHWHHTTHFMRIPLALHHTGDTWGIKNPVRHEHIFLDQAWSQRVERASWMFSYWFPRIPHSLLRHWHL